jgi:hypothetical protein
VIEVPGTAEPTAFEAEDPPSLSVLVMVRVAWAFRVSVSVAETAEASVKPRRWPCSRRWSRWPPRGTVPASWRVTDWPEAREARVQVSVVELKVTPDGRFGLVMLVKPWVGRVSTTLRLEASLGPVFVTTTCRCRPCRPRWKDTPSVLVMARVAWAFRVSVSVA